MAYEIFKNIGLPQDLIIHIVAEAECDPLAHIFIRRRKLTELR